ncbi:uncharacterized protein LOC124376398 [Silurus meridionalis]|uniref:PH domain-containing protein n=1 Tax=Silurus meridionalis TaxID=175797 RepID=A0A8T0AK34_SILME|nr:uncharacterized protein LOC124376398 [Silurus meridionalis]KAF7691127.1 hypothetical protein HF521_011424 [Silurus meridionalis]
MFAGEVCMPLCQGFLKKRKDKIRLRWATYWFKLHNATLFFYNRKHGNITDLRGKYYLSEVESVRELTHTKKKHYTFEIALKNGKRKVLAAETADLRQHWMCQILQAMNHNVCNTTEPNSNWEPGLDHECRSWSSSCSDLQSPHDSRLPPNIQSVAVTPISPIYVDLSMPYNSQFPEADVKQQDDVIEPENDYDVLPVCKPLEYEEVIYDTPPSNRRASEREHDTAESIYDIPKFAFKKSINVGSAEASCAKELPEITGLLQDMVTCLGGNSADWARATAPGAICQP